MQFSRNKLSIFLEQKLGDRALGLQRGDREKPKTYGVNIIIDGLLKVCMVPPSPLNSHVEDVTLKRQYWEVGS